MNRNEGVVTTPSMRNHAVDSEPSWSSHWRRHVEMNVCGERWAVSARTPGSQWIRVEADWGLRQVERSLWNEGTEGIRRLLDDEGCTVSPDDGHVIAEFARLLDLGRIGLWVLDHEGAVFGVDPANC